jgi:methionine-rich copper-binding protein CopC
MRSMTLIRRNLLGAALLCGGAGSAHAHAFLDHAQPAVGRTLKQAPAEIRMWFTEALEPAFSTAEVVDAKGTAEAEGKAQVDPSDPKILHVAVKSLPPGVYTVLWRVVSVDTHKTNGKFTFTVAP